MLSLGKQGHYIVLGDVMVDEYIGGTVSRISPEAPIPILQFTATERFPGGAANVAMNLAGLGHAVELIGVVGDDEPGRWLLREVQSKGVQSDGLLVDASRPTIRKVRYGTPQQAILRVDYEDTKDVSWSVSADIGDILQSKARDNVDALLVSDYAKGLVTISVDSPLSQAIQRISLAGLLTGVDTKKKRHQVGSFSGFTFIKPNLTELRVLTEMSIVTDTDLWQACDRLSEETNITHIVVTMGHEGMALRTPTARRRVPTAPCSVFDVTGAGDTAFATLASCIGTGCSWLEAVHVANVAAASVVELRGTRTITREILEERIEGIGYESSSDHSLRRDGAGSSRAASE